MITLQSMYYLSQVVFINITCLVDQIHLITRQLSRDNLSSLSDLDLWPTWMKVSHCTSTHSGEQLCKSIFKSIHKHTSYGPDKSRQKENHGAKLIQNPSVNVEVMVWTNPDRLTQAWMRKQQWTLLCTQTEIFLLILENNCVKLF